VLIHISPWGIHPEGKLALRLWWRWEDGGCVLVLLF
jgi:hypothetical protein